MQGLGLVQPTVSAGVCGVLYGRRYHSWRLGCDGRSASSLRPLRLLFQTRGAGFSEDLLPEIQTEVSSLGSEVSGVGVVKPSTLPACTGSGARLHINVARQLAHLPPRAAVLRAWQTAARVGAESVARRASRSDSPPPICTRSSRALHSSSAETKTTR